MNQIKRLTAFLLTFIMCLQVMAFSAFAADNLEFNISGDDLVDSIKVPAMLAMKTATVNFEVVNSEDNITSYGALNNEVIFRYSVNNDTKNVTSIFIAATLSSFQKQTDVTNFFALVLTACEEVNSGDNELDTAAFLKGIEWTNTGTGLKSYSHNNVLCRKIVDKGVISFYITPEPSTTQNEKDTNAKIEEADQPKESEQPQQEEKTQSTTQTKQPEQQTQPTPQSQNNAISVVIDGQPLVSNVAPQSINGRTMVPVRGIFEALGATVEWNATTKQVIATKGNDKVTLTLDSATAYINGEAKTLESPAISYNGSTLVPARFVAEAFGATVTWDNATKTVNIVSETKPTETVPTSAQPEESKSEPEQTTTPKQVVAEKPQQIAHQGNTVYVTKTGKKYHYDDSCNGGTYYASTLESAKSRGLTACDKCA